MEDALRVQIHHPPGDVPRERDPDAVGELHGQILYELLQGTPVYVLGEGVQLALVHAHAHEFQDVRVVELVHQLHLLQHVAPVRGQQVHLQHHHLACDAVRHLCDNENCKIIGLEKNFPVSQSGVRGQN